MFAILAAFVVLTVAPGPANLAVAAVSMSRGRLDGFRFAAGLGVGFAFWGVIAATGLGSLLQASAHAMFVLKIVGGAYLLWLALLSLRNATSVDVKSVSAPQRNWFTAGMVMNLSNPKAIVAWLAALAAGFGENNTTTQLVTVTAICIAIGFANYFGYAALFSFQACMSLYRRFAKWVDGVMAAVFAATGLAIIKSAFSRSS
ncbi:MAG: LysE family translocator [Pseudomonadota bacterium]